MNGHSPSTTADDVLCEAKRLIVKFGWQRLAWPEFGPQPRCIRAAIDWAARSSGCFRTNAHTDALRRVSEAIYNERGVIGGIMEWEFRKRTDKDAVVAVLQKAIEMGPSERETAGIGLWPT